MAYAAWVISVARQAYLDAARVAVDLLAAPAVAARWTEPSALSGLRVAGLAGHLARQVTQVRKISAEPAAVGTPIEVLEHFARSTWNSTGSADPVHVEIRERAEQSASVGLPALLEETRAALDSLRADLTTEPEDRVVELCGLWCLTFDGLLTTRLLELVVHTDDLAVSVALSTPEIPVAAADIVVDLLGRLAARRHGAIPVIRALSRAERAPAAVRALAGDCGARSRRPSRHLLVVGGGGGVGARRDGDCAQIQWRQANRPMTSTSGGPAGT